MRRILTSVLSIIKMLTLTRKPGESIKVGNDIIITVNEIADKKATLSVKDQEDQVITLGHGESTMLTADIKVILKSITNRVSLCIEAPAEVRIERETNV